MRSPAVVQRTRYGRRAKLTCYVIAVAGSQAERITTQKSVVSSTSPNQTGIALIAIRQSVAAVRTLPHRIVLNLVIVGLFSDQTGRAHFIAKDITAIDGWLAHGAIDEINHRLTALHEAVAKVVFLKPIRIDPMRFEDSLQLLSVNMVLAQQGQIPGRSAVHRLCGSCMNL